MAAYNGKLGFITLDAERVEVSKWSINKETSISDSTDSSSGGAQTHTVGRYTWTGTFEGWLDDTENVVTQIGSGTEGAVQLYTNATKFFAGDITVTSFNVETDIGPNGETVKFTGSFTGNGTLTDPL